MKNTAEQSSTAEPLSVPISTRSKWEIRLNILQLLLLWFILAAAIVGVFFVGLIVGQDHGLQTALNEQAKQLLRFPVDVPPERVTNDISENDVAEVDKLASVKTPESATRRAPVIEQKTEVVTSVSPPETPAKDVREIVPPTAAKSVVAGFNALPAGEELKPVERAPAKSDEQIKIGDTRNEAAEEQDDEGASAQEATPPPIATTAPEREQKVITAGTARDNSLAEPTSGWYVQVSAAKSKQEALSIRDRLEATGVPSRIQQAQVKNVLYYRVLAGPYSERKQVEAALSRIKGLPMTRGEPFIKRIG